MLARRNRIPSSFFPTREKPRDRATSPFFTVRVWDGKTPANRFAVIVSRKVAKTAVLRNRIRRIIYSLIHQNKFDVREDCYDVVIIAQKGITHATTQEIAEHLVKTLNKIFQ